jgi:hypothetical protein
MEKRPQSTDSKSRLKEKTGKFDTEIWNLVFLGEWWFFSPRSKWGCLTTKGENRECKSGLLTVWSPGWRMLLGT